MASARTESSNFGRVVAILCAFDEGNTPQRSADLLKRLGIGRTTGFALLRAMVRAGLLRRVDTGLVALGPGAQDLAFHPMGPDLGGQSARQTVRAAARARPVQAPGLAEPWNPLLVARVTATRGRRPGPWRIGFSNASTDNPWRSALIRNVTYGARLLGAEIARFHHADAGNDPARQAEQIRAWRADGIDGLLISAAPDPEGALGEVLDRLIDDGIPVVAVDRRPLDHDRYTAFVTASDHRIGQTSALWLAEHLNGAGRVWMLSGLEGSSPALRRRQAAEGIFAAHPGIEVEAHAFTGWTPRGGAEAVAALMAEHGQPPQAVWCDSGLQGVGSLQAFLDLGLAPPPHTGGDLNQMYKLCLSRSVPFAAVDYPATMGGHALRTLLGLLAGDAVRRRIETPLTVVLPRGLETRSVRADRWAELHVRWDLPDDVVLSQGPSLARRRSRAASA